MKLSMKSTIILILTFLAFNKTSIGQSITNKTESSPPKIEKTIFACGASIDKVYIKYVIGLIKKVKPKVCFIPTAVYDDPLEIIKWYEDCSTLNVTPTVLKTYVQCDSSQLTFEEQL